MAEDPRVYVPVTVGVQSPSRDLYFGSADANIVEPQVLRITTYEFRLRVLGDGDFQGDHFVKMRVVEADTRTRVFESDDGRLAHFASVRNDRLAPLVLAVVHAIQFGITTAIAEREELRRRGLELPEHETSVEARLSIIIDPLMPWTRRSVVSRTVWSPLRHLDASRDVVLA